VLTLVPLAEDLVGRTADWLISAAGGDFSATAAVFPNKRFLYFLRRELCRRQEGPFFPPQLLTIDALFDSLFNLNTPGFVACGDLEASYVLWECSLRELPEQTDPAFAAFYPRARQLLRACEEILVEGGDFEHVSVDLFQEFAALGEYHLPFRAFIERLPALLGGFVDRMRERRLASRGFRWHTVARLAEAEDLILPPVERWLFCGLNVLNRNEEKLLRRLFAAGTGHLILQTDRAALADPWSPFAPQKRTIDLLGLTVDEPGPAGAPAFWNRFAGRVFLHPAAGIEDEMEQAQRLIEEAVRQNPDALTRIGVALPNGASLVPFVQGCVSRFDMSAKTVPFNITLGYPLSRTPVFQLIDAALALAESRQGEYLSAAAYLRLIRHPYCKLSAVPEREEWLRRGIHRLEETIAERNLVRFRPVDLLAGLDPEAPESEGAVLPSEGETPIDEGAAVRREIESLHARFLLPPAPPTLPADVLPFLEAILSFLAGEGGGRYLLLREFLAAANEALAELLAFRDRYPAAFVDTSFSAVASLVRRHFEMQQVNFEGSPVRGVQVMGMLEFRGLSFDRVFVCDALEGILPESVKYDPILPADVRRVLGISEPDVSERLFALNFFSLVGSARQVHLLYPRNREGGRERERSRFIERIVYELEKAGEAAAVPAVGLFPPLPATVPKIIAKGKELRCRLDSLTFSPSALETYLHCPARFYYGFVLGFMERERAASETDGGLIGAIAHRILREFFGRYPRGGREGEWSAGLRPLIEEGYREFHLDPAAGLEKMRVWALERRLREFLVADSARLAAMGAFVQEREMRLASEFVLPGRPRPVPVAGYADRLERENERWRIVDYKTGAAFPARVAPAGFLNRLAEESDVPLYLERLRRFAVAGRGFQVLLYMLLFARQRQVPFAAVSGAYCFLREPDAFFKPLSARDDGDDPATLLEGFAADLIEVLRDVFGRAAFHPNASDAAYCRHCPFRAPCGNL